MTATRYRCGGAWSVASGDHAAAFQRANRAAYGGAFSLRGVCDTGVCGAAGFDSAVIMRGIPHTWHALREVPELVGTAA